MSATSHGPLNDTGSTTGTHMELPCMPPMSSFQPEQGNANQSIVLEVAHIPQDAKDWLASLLEGKFSRIISKFPTDVGRINLFKMDIPMIGSPAAHKPYPSPLECQMFVNGEIKLLENAGCISKSLSLWAALVTIVLKKPDILNPHKQ